MRFGSRSLFLGLVFASVFTILAPPARADTFAYSYTGNPFTSFTGYQCTGVGPCSVQGSFTTASALLPNTTYGNPLVYSGAFGVNPLSISFTDGTAALTDNYYLDVQTGADGQIVNWYVAMGEHGSNYLSTVQWPSAKEPYWPFDEGSTQLDVNGITQTPGTWTMEDIPAADTPEPPTGTLFGSGALVLSGLAIRRRHPAPI